MSVKMTCGGSRFAVWRYDGKRLCYLQDRRDSTWVVWELADNWEAWTKLLAEGPTPLDAFRNAAFGDRLEMCRILKSPSGQMRAQVFDLRTAVIDCPDRGLLRIYDPLASQYSTTDRFLRIRAIL